MSVLSVSLEHIMSLLSVSLEHIVSLLSVSLEHIVSVLSSLLKNTSGSQQQRLLGKFTENDHEKVDRLVELHFKYLDKLRAIDDKIELAKRVGLTNSQICNSIDNNVFEMLLNT